MSFTEDDKVLIRSFCNEVTYMMFDLENGNHIRPDGSNVDIDGVWSFNYGAKLLSDTITETQYGPVKTIVKDFTIKVIYSGRTVLDFDFNQQTRALQLRAVDAFYTSMFLDILDAYRRKMFNVTEP